jgi:VWFA-related protein
MTVVMLAGTVSLRAGQAPNNAGAPAQAPTFKVQVDYVEVDVFVTDQNGNAVSDLKQEDFQVFEDGKRQTVTNFTTVNIPIERADRPLFAKQPIEPDVRSNERPFDGRVYVLIMDEAHTNPINSNRVRAVARKFIQENMGANDLMAVVHTKGPDQNSQEFTGNKRLLLKSVDSFIGEKPRSATLERLDQFNAQAGIQAAGGQVDLRDPFEFERSMNARGLLDTLNGVADWFGSVRGRKKTMLLFSEGIDYNIYDPFSNRDAGLLVVRMQDLIRATAKANVTIYAIDPRGLEAIPEGAIELQSVSEPGLDQRALANELRLSQDSLRTFAEETGGFAVTNTNGFATAYDRIVRENSTYYVLAYYPPNPKRDGRFHKIEVRVTRPGLVVRARRGYANPSGKPPAPSKSDLSTEIQDALGSPLPISGLGMKIFVAPFKGVAPNASVLVGVELRGRDISTDANAKIELSTFAVDAKGKIKASTKDNVTLNLKPETKERIEQMGLRALRRIDIPPGRYQVRVAAHDANGGAVGSVIYDLEVPDFYQQPLAMSGLVLTSPSAAALPTVNPDADLRQVLPGSPAAARSFPQNEEIALFADVYDNNVSTPHKVDIVTTVTADDGRVVFKNEEERSSEDLGGKRGGFGYTTRIRLEDIDPGSYVLKVEARSRLGDGVAASRETEFTVTEPKRP